MSREEDMFMYRQEVLDHREDGCTEMTDTISIISLTCIITDQEASLTEVVHQVFIMEMEDYKGSLTEVIIIRGAARVLMLCTETLVHLTEVVP